MKVRISILEMDQYGEEEVVKYWDVITDSISRALQMYEDELDERYMQRLVYQIL